MKQDFLRIARSKVFNRCAALLLALAMSAPAATAETSIPVNQFALDNGLRVIVVPDHRVPIVTHMVWYEIGGIDELPGEEGVAHFLEHMMFMGTETTAKGEFDRFIMSQGGAQNATTRHDSTVYYQRVPKPALPRLMDLEADRMVNLRINPEDAASERNVVMEEYRRQMTGISTQSDLAEFRAAYDGHAYGRQLGGTKENIEALSAEKAMGFYKRNYRPERAIVVVAGDVTEDEVRHLAGETFGRIPRSEGMEPRKLIKPQPLAMNKRIIDAHERASSVSLTRRYIINDTETLSIRDVRALQLFASVAGDSITGTIHRQLVLKEAKASNASCGFSLRLLSGEFSFSAVALPGVGADDLEESFDKAIATLAENGISEEDFELTKQRFLANQAYFRDNAYNLADWFGDALVTGLATSDISNYEAEVTSLTHADVNTIAKRVLGGSHYVTSLLVPKEKAAAASTTAVK